MLLLLLPALLQLLVVGLVKLGRFRSPVEDSICYSLCSSSSSSSSSSRQAIVTLT
jgi:hypothetical protein